MSSPCISVQEVGVQSLHIYKEVRTLLNHVLIIVLGFTSLIQLGVIIIYKADTFTELAYFYIKSFLLSTHTYVFTFSKFLNSPSLPPIPIRLIGHINIDVFYIQKLLFFAFFSDFVLEQHNRIELSYPHWKCGVITIILMLHIITLSSQTE